MTLHKYSGGMNISALGAIGFLSATAAWLTGSSFWWLVGGIVLGAVIPFTLIVIFTTNKSCWIRLWTKVLSRRQSFIQGK